MPVVSAIFPKLYKIPCDCILIIRLLQCQTDTGEPHYLNTVLCKTSKYATPHTGELNDITFVSHEAHDFKAYETVKCCPGLEQHTSREWQVHSSHEQLAMPNMVQHRLQVLTSPTYYAVFQRIFISFLQHLQPPGTLQ